MTVYKKGVICLLIMVFAPALLPAADGYWFTRPDLPTPRQEILPGELDGKIYVIGGWLNGYSITDVVEMYDPATNTWTTLPPLPRPRHHCALASVDGILYVVGGYFNTSWPWYSMDTTLAYDPVANEWSNRATMIVGRGEHTVSVYDGKIYAFGGNDLYGNVTDVVEVYDPVADTWTEVASMPTPRHHHASVVVDSLIYVVGGRQGYWGTPYTMIDPVEAYSPASDTWYSVTTIPNPRGGLSAAGIDGKLYTFGGEIPGIFEEVEEYDPATDSWRLMTPMLTPRHGTAAVVIADTVFIIGGSRAEGMLTDNSNEGFVLGTCVDSDHDGYGDSDDPQNTCPLDNCPLVYNPDQLDNDADGTGDVCDTDDDEDGVDDETDNCPLTGNPGQEDYDGDGSGDVCDEDDDDDGVADLIDNCQFRQNPYQYDTDSDGAGDSCDCCGWYTGNLTGNANCSDDGKLTLSDISRMIDRVYISKVELCCPSAGNTNGDEECKVTLSDISRLIDAVFISKLPAETCMLQCEV